MTPKDPILTKDGRVCNKCQKFKLWSEFHINRSMATGYAARCMKCENGIFGSNGHVAHLAKRYGVSAEWYADKLKRQNGVCVACKEFCATGKRLTVDHNHTTGKVRELLCLGCNLAIGNTYENPVTLRALADYLENTTSISC